MIRAIDRKLLRDVWRLRSQVIAISLVVACGIATYILASSALDSLKEAKEIYYERYRMADLFASAKRAPLILVEQLREIDGVSAVDARVRYGVTLDVADMQEPATGVLISVPDIGEPPLNALYLLRGQMIEPGATDKVLVSEAFATAHNFSPGDQLQAVINGRLRTLTITGIVLSPEFVYSIAPGNIMPDDRRYGVLWMNRRALEAAVDMDGAFNDLLVGVMPGANVNEIRDKVDRLLAPYGGLDSYLLKDQISNWFVENELRELRGSAIIVPLIFLAVAAFLLNIVLSRQIATEREQIGILKAMGLSDRAVGMHYFKFAAAIVLIGVAIGTALGAWTGEGLTQLYTRFFRFPVLAYVFSLKTVFIAVGLSLLAAVLGTWRAVSKVVALPPAEAMHPASPTSYRRMLIERLGLQRILSQPARMIIRHLERRPGRAALSIIGMSLSVAILIAAMFALDAIWHMIDVQYNIATREDVTLTFNEKKAESALDEVKKLPGVLTAEPFRTVPVRFRHGHREHRSGITGIPAEGQLRRVVDFQLHAVPVPEVGLMLSDKLAEILDVTVGDRVTLEVLEGRKPIVDTPVTGIVREYLGANAYMEIGALNELMDDPPTLSGAALLTEKGDNAALLRKIKETPQIMGTILKDVAIRAVHEILAEFIIQQTVFNVVFAGMIAFGVVYNTARISLSERARELASLRVLGLSQREVAYILLGELVVLMLISLPIGLWLGWVLALGVGESLDTELFRLPVVISNKTYGSAVLTVVGASLLSGFAIWRRISKLDIVAVLKTRE